MNMPLLNLSADTAPALLKALREVDIKVPSITKGRSHTHRERYLMARFLATTAESQLIDYPLTVTHRDKPDFVLQIASNLIGVECIEAVPEEWYEIEAIRGRKYPHAFNFGQKFEPGKKLFNSQQKDEIASGNRAGLPWMGNSAELEWAEAMAHFIRLKTEKLRSGDYTETHNMWLLIQDEWRVPIHDPEEIKEAATLCLPLIAHLQVQPCFSAIFICCRGWLLSFGHGNYSMEPIRELWRDD
ncbi:hypothetical protein SAMN05216213_101283 [Ectopseudomonas guguanensis]|uniref:Uncharacterized protein n=2 Tax=Ectopseudomonas guguanensis TaxID=1198456 RepID=A0A1H0KFZ9_9GAMM|nr:hypothetical protein SAMN05216213_101283 [Pseudomonas guguanensis]